jgi:hypothetical protein
MASQDYKYDLSRNIDQYLAALSKLYEQEGERALQQVIVNAAIRVQEEWSYDNWNGGTAGHSVHLVLPDQIYLSVARNKDSFEEKISTDINKIHNFRNEFIEKVFLEMDLVVDGDWRQKSGALIQSTRNVSEPVVKRIWKENEFRLFLSHKTEVKKETAHLKDRLSIYGVSCFVAHEDIHPTQEWQDEIENALATMDGFVALMTTNFHESSWTDQEVGYALARGVPIIPVRFGLDPYGFIGKFQGLSATWDGAPEAIVKVLVKHDRMLAAYFSALRTCSSFDRGNLLAGVLSGIDKLTEAQVDALIDAYNSNVELQGSFGFNGSRPALYGPGLLSYLNTWSRRRFERDADWKIISKD